MKREHGDPNQLISEHGTPLHLAVIANDVLLTQKLILDEARTTIQNEFGLTPIQLARLLGRKECLSLFQVVDKTNIQVISSDQQHKQCEAEAFKAHFGIEWTPSLVFKKFSFLNAVLHKIKSYPKESGLAIERSWLGALYKPFLDSYHLPKVRIQWIDAEIGYGLFSNQLFKPKEFIGEYTGEVRRYLWMFGKSTNYVGEYSLGGKDPTRFIIDARHKGNHTRFINHSDCPNTSAITVISGALLHVLFYAEKSIAQDEQITFDYGPYYWRGRKPRRLL